jgi:hypothetical protein
MNMQVWVGGNLPESALEELIDELRDDKVKLIDGWDHGDDVEEIEKLLRDFKEPNSIEFEFEMEYEQDGTPATTLNLDHYCQRHGLTIKKLLPPCTNDEGEHANECYYYWAPGMSAAEYIPTSGEGDISLLQKDVLELLDACTALSQRPLSDMPLLINDKDDVTRLYAKASMADKSFPEIFRELLISRVGHEEVGCPEFKIIPGR